MGLLILLGVCFLWWCVYTIGRDLAAESRKRRETRIWLAWEREEAARLEASTHQRRLAVIEATRLEGIRELRRIAAEAPGEVIEGSAIEVRNDRA
jgi:hypothetical protein